MNLKIHINFLFSVSAARNKLDIPKTFFELMLARKETILALVVFSSIDIFLVLQVDYQKNSPMQYILRSILRFIGDTRMRS